MNRDPRRLASHLDRGGNIFLSHRRMREIRREEAIIRSRARREGDPDPVITHIHWHCPTGCCQGCPTYHPRDGGRP